MIDLPTAIIAYADRMHRAIGAEHDRQHVASPLGAWLVIALVASARDDDALADALGCPPAEAAALARQLLARPHQVIVLAAAVWHGVDTPELTAWLHTLGGSVEVGALPSQAAADQWADRHTLGLIGRFPLAITPQTLLVLASAVAAKIDWRAPFDKAPDTLPRLARSAGFAGIGLLRSPGVATAFVADSQHGQVAVHAMPSAANDLLVVSVIAAESVTAADVLAVAHPIAVALAARVEVPGRRSVFDLPLSAGHSWSIDETTGWGARDVERYDSVLAAWHARSDHDLMAMPSLGFGSAADSVRALGAGAGVDARQAALARYTRTGFEAAAVTAMAGRLSAMTQHSGVRVRSALLEFTRPHAVVAVAVDRTDGSPWAALPVFSAWVTTGDEPA